MNITHYFTKDLFQGKTVFITGGSSGINLGIARNFAAVGASLGIVGRTRKKLDAAAAELPAARICPAPGRGCRQLVLAEMAKAKG